MKELKFIDLYAGIGGIRFAFESAGASCIFSSEWNKYAQITYESFHGELPEGDISGFKPKDIPNHNILTAGFPCQPFSLAGVSKKNSMGRAHGFDDPTQGTEFFKVKQILKTKKPEAFLLENVKNLKNHDKGNTFKIIEEQLDNAGYHFKDFIVNSKSWVPQSRERIFIVGFKKKFRLKKWLNQLEMAVPDKRLYELADVLIKEKDLRKKYGHKYTLTPGTWAALQRHKSNHFNKGNGFGFGLIERPFKDKVTRTMSARYHKDGAEILIQQTDTEVPRRIVPYEAAKLQGFPESICKRLKGGDCPVSDSQLYKQFGNSVSVPVIQMFSKLIVDKLEELGV
tara:strand:+ start:12526 stop:13545 length:1020 start_codon:yes stop_codon:yes gene_type:complete